MSDLQAEVERLHGIIAEFVYAEHEYKKSEQKLKELNDRADRLYEVGQKEPSDIVALKLRSENLQACIKQAEVNGVARRRLEAARRVFEELVKEANSE